MKLIKGNREAHWIPFDKGLRKQVKRVGDRKFGYVEFDSTKEEKKTAVRLGRPARHHRAWVNISSLAEHGGV